MKRRDFLKLTGAGATAAAVSGCATNPVTGKSQFMLISEAQERQIDLENAPHQISTDFGAYEDPVVNNYLVTLGSSLIPHSHRPHLPYSFTPTRSVAVNAYTFPAGTVAVNRGLLLNLRDEAELAAVLGHELGHVSARHSGARMSKGMLINVAVASAAAYLEHEGHETSAMVTAGLGGVGGAMLLASYSRENEFQADSLGIGYAAAIGQNPTGMATTMQLFSELSQSEPSIVEILFSTHPQSKDRVLAAQEQATTQFGNLCNADRNRDRYMDATATIRRDADAIRLIQKAYQAMAKDDAQTAKSLLEQALKKAPDDYTALVLMSKVYHAIGDQTNAYAYAKRASTIDPDEGQAVHMLGMTLLEGGRPSAALHAFTRYTQMLPGNPNPVYLQGLCNERMGNRKAAAQYYLAYRNIVGYGELRQKADQRLLEWGVLQPVQ